MSARPCLADYEIGDFNLELILLQIVSLYLIDTDRRQQLAACTPVAWDSTHRTGGEL